MQTLASRDQRKCETREKLFFASHAAWQAKPGVTIMLVANKKDQRHLRTVFDEDILRLCKEFDLKGVIKQETTVMQAEVITPSLT